MPIQKSIPHKNITGRYYIPIYKHYVKICYYMYMFHLSVYAQTKVTLYFFKKSRK